MIGTLIRTSSSSVASIVPHVFHRFSAGATLVAQETTSYVAAAGFTGWIGDLFTWLMTKLMGFVGVLMSGGVYTFLVFDSPYTDPQYLQAFDHLLGIFPQLLAVVVMAGFASQPFSKKADVDSVILAWKALKAIIFVAVGRQLMHFGLLLVNAVVTYIYPQSYGTFSTEILKSGMEGAAASAGVVAVGMVILSVTSIIGILLLFAMLIVREFLFVAMFVTLPILAVMLYLDFGPFEDSAKAAKMFINATLSLFLAGIFMAALMFVGTVAVGGGGHAAANAAANAGSNPGSFNDVLESFLFWLIGLVAPALYGLKTAMSSGFIPGRVRSRRKRSSGSRSAASSGRSGESSRASIMKQARFGGKRAGSAATTASAFAGSAINKADTHATGGRVTGTADKASSAVQSAKSHAVSTASSKTPDTFSKYGRAAGHYGKKGGKRVAKDTAAGTNFTLRNLDRSPLDWAEAGLEHYRENPVINTPTDETKLGQRTLDEFESSSEKRRSE